MVDARPNYISQSQTVRRRASANTSDPHPVVSEDTEWVVEARARQKEFETVFRKWKQFDLHQRDLIKSMVGLIFFGTETTERTPPIGTYYTLYNEERQTIILKVYDEICKRTDQNWVELSCTFLVCKLENNVFLFPVIRCKSPDSHDLHFFDVTGAYYKNWNAFVKLNKLPPCEYIAPLNGLYTTPKTNYEVFNSPSLNTSFTSDLAELGCLAARYIMPIMPPFVSAIASGSVTGVGALNVSYIGSALGVGAVGIGSAVATSILRRMQLINVDDENAIPTSNDVLDLFKVVDFYRKVTDGEASLRDVYDFSLQLFVVCGAVVNVQELRNMLLQPSVDIAINRILTRIQREEIQRRAETSHDIRRYYSPVGVLRVGPMDIYTALKLLTLHVGSVGVNLMLSIFPKSEIIYDYFLDIKYPTTRDYYDAEMMEKIFDNLYYIAQLDLERMKTVLKCYISNAAITEEDDIVQICSNEIDDVYHAAESVTEGVFGTFCPDIIEPHSDSAAEIRTECLTSRDGLDKQIFVLLSVKHLCFKYGMSGSTNTFLQYFDRVLKLFTKELVERMLKCYNRFITLTTNIVGEEKVKIMASTLGMKTADDFLPTSLLFDRITKEVTDEIEKLLVSENEGSSLNTEPSPVAVDVYDTLVTLIPILYAKVVVTNCIGIEQMTNILRNIVDELIKKLSERIEKLHAQATELHQEIMETLECQEVVEDVLRSISVPLEEGEIFHHAVISLNENDLVVGILQKSHHKYEKIVLAENLRAEKVTDETVLATFITVSVKLFDKIVESKVADCWSTTEVFKKVVHFMAVKFKDELRRDVEQYESLKGNISIVGSQIFKKMLNGIGVLGQTSALICKKAQNLDDEDVLNLMVPEFVEYYCKNTIELHHPKLFDMIISGGVLDVTLNDGIFTAYKINCRSRESDQFYRLLAIALFKVNVDPVAPVFKSKHSIVLKARNHRVIFNFIRGSDTALVILC